jgi:uncharacterized protein (DUF488 family)
MGIQLFTIGYEGRNLDAFLTCLLENDVDCLVDVREIAFSRKKGFSKRALSAALEDWGIQYLHIKELGSPSLLREELKSTGDYGRFFAGMDEHLANQKESIERAYAQATQSRCCLMCYEKLAVMCHRKVVARKIKERDGNGMQVTHL